MKILLTTLNSKYVHSNLALKYLYATAAEHAGCIEVREFTINNDDDHIFVELLRGDYDVICFSCYIWNIEKLLYLCKNLKKARPSLKIVLGGPEVSFDTLELMKAHKQIDFIMQGEGEYTFNALCGELLKDAGSQSYESIKGLVYRLGGKIFVNLPVDDLDFAGLPFPYEFFPCETDKVIYYESVRGCPYRCTYCLSSVEKNVRSLPLEQVKTHLRYFIRKNVKQVKFIDRTFNWNKQRCLEILEYLIEIDNGVTNFHFEMCGELLDEDIVASLAKARNGQFQVEIGIQSANPKVLRAINRNDNIAQQLGNIAHVTELSNLHTHVDLIVGLPFEDYASFRNSFNHVYALGADNLQLGFLKLLKGTEIRKNANAYGYQFRSRAPYEVISNQFISAGDLALLKQIEHVLNLFYNKGGFTRALKHMIYLFGKTPFDFYEELAFFYHLKGYQNKSHKKEDLYRILFQYARWKDRSISDFSEETLILLEQDMEETINFDAIKKFKRKGWMIQ